MLTTLAGTLACMAIAFGGGLVQGGWLLSGLVSMGLGSIIMGLLFAVAKLEGFTHFVAGQASGLYTHDLAMFFVEDQLPRKVFVQVEGVPVRAAAMYTARYDGSEAFIIEGVSDGTNVQA